MSVKMLIKHRLLCALKIHIFNNLHDLAENKMSRKIAKIIANIKTLKKYANSNMQNSLKENRAPHF